MVLKIKNNQMTDLINMLEEHYSVLRERGYSEIGLGTEDLPGRFMEQLEQTFSYHLKESFFKKSIREFELHAVGFFNNEQNMMAFLFRYVLDPRNNKIELKSLKVDMEGTSEEFYFKNGLYELPHTRKLILLLSKKDEHQISESVISSKLMEDECLSEIYHKNLIEYQTLLATKGYTDKAHFPYHNDFLFKKLESRLSTRLADPVHPAEFVVRTKGFFDNGNVEVNFSLFYSLDKNDKKLLLNFLSADYGKKRIIFPLQEINELPSAVIVWKSFMGEIKYPNAQVIYPKEQLQVELQAQEEILGSMGYYKSLISNDSNFIDRELQSTLQKKIWETEHQSIPVIRTIKLNLHESMQCVFNYSFDPVQIKLQLESLTANVGKVNRKYFPSELPATTLQKIFEELNEVSRLHNARSVISRITPDKAHMSYKKRL